ncbi:MAG TPA: hypothetical protein VL137_00730 [Polyangiaceae bacterium]|nr:hypothetical protein [Polyangiaceae bacterium]
MSHAFRIGADENGLGAQLGPLVVTAVLAEISSASADKLWKRLPKRVKNDLNDSKRLVSHGNIELAEAWVRALVGPSAQNPAALFQALTLETLADLQSPCPSAAKEQCWRDGHEEFTAPSEMVERASGHLSWLAAQGLRVTAVKTSITCTKLLNSAKVDGGNRFVSDLHSMERLVIALQELAGAPVRAVCGKVGGIADYSRFFGPLSYRLHAVMKLEKRHSAYQFPGLGELHFMQDADASDPLVMLASLVGKYVRELLMARIAAHYALKNAENEPFMVSGYNDPRTARFITLTAPLRKKTGIPHTCFKRKAVGTRR